MATPEEAPCGVWEFHGLKLGEDCSDKNLRLDLQEKPIGIVG